MYGVFFLTFSAPYSVLFRFSGTACSNRLGSKGVHTFPVL
jgi:hypothetical protein